MPEGKAGPPEVGRPTARGYFAPTPATRPPRSRTSSTGSNLAKGQTGLSIAFDLPTQTGYDSDNELAKGEVGKVGVPVRTWATCGPCSPASRSTR